MRSARALLVAVTAVACGGGTSPSGAGVLPENVLALSVNGASCSRSSFPNKPCVKVTICVPGTSTCRTIGDVLLDTGSFGLRLFSQAVDISLPQANVTAGALAECVQYGDGTAHWGPVRIASVVLAGEPPIDAAIQLIDSTFGSVPTGCPNPTASPSEAGFNGILGVGVFAQDCGPGCAASADNGIYFACSGPTCNGTAVPVESQVQNPVALLPLDSNGVIIDLPAVAPGGAPSAEGSLVFGIGTRAENAPSGATAYSLDLHGQLTTTLQGSAASSGFFDTGSNGLFFAPPAGADLPTCPSPASSWFCPPTTLSLSATNTGASGETGPPVSFRIGRFTTLLASGNAVFSEIGGLVPAPGGFDWGLPFYFGRRVYVGLEGRSSPLGTGPYVAY